MKCSGASQPIMEKNRRHWAVLFVAMVLGASAQAQIYKWTDSEGRVHFSDQAPADQSSTSVNVREVPTETGEQDLSEQEHLERQKRLARVLEEERLEKEQAQAAREADLAKKAAYCERLRNRLQRMDQASRVYSEQKDGTIRYLDDAEADQFKIDMRGRFERECN